MKILFLDDMGERHTGFLKHFMGDPTHGIWNTYSVKEAQAAMLSIDKFDIVFLDHDLNEADYLPDSMQYEGVQKGLNGADMAKWIAQLPKEKQPTIAVVHSMNPIGAIRMCEILRDGGVTVRRWVFNSTENPLEALGLL